MKQKQIIPCLVMLVLLFRCSFAADDAAIYGKTNPDDYVTGRFNPAKHELFVSLADSGIPTNKWPHLLRKEAAGALKELYAAFRKEHPQAPFWVQSSTRSFVDQKNIWDGKWNGTITVKNVGLSRNVKDPMKRALEILKFSSMPGTSRHHWGTDFDLNVLENSYYETGEGRVLYFWMKEHAGRFGFCQPYTAGRKTGYHEEKWHWSYKPLARIFLERWNSLHRKNPGVFSRKGLFGGSEVSGKLAPVYVNAINRDCD
ncbi:MAG TPA: M15 family metallopeptidase [Spirochaetota bacterium]|nr:M15 family metallopeptidase [Spirochaetota bacterium]HPL17437.1 M15 family metallopeptidase [Spirochaetota bacterium]HRS76490.1 M15 family metallopeptidase [Spirochaetota bacterium]HRT74920.1 M15 family metallopeptidase [Spirochaetota bacterium]